jgi:hypothetical protein
VTEPSRTERRPYSPQLRTAVVLTGTGADGAYHAGVLRALQEAGVKIDVIAGHGVGAAGALFAAIDGGTRLWERGGLWRHPQLGRLYPWRGTLRFLGWLLAAGAVIIAVPLVALALGLLVYEIGTLADVAGAGTSAWLASWYATTVEAAFAPQALPTWLPRIALVVVVLMIAAVIGAAVRARLTWPARRGHRGGLWWISLVPPVSGREAAAYFRSGLWDLIKGGARIAEPDTRDLARRYTELLADNLGQPGFRELLIAVHDLDARRDLVFALLCEEHRRAFFLKRPALGTDRRSAEAFDLSGIARDHALQALAGALSLPLVTEPPLVLFTPESYWRGEAHRTSDRSGLLVRVLEEVAAAAVRQVILVSAAADLEGPHGLSRRRVTPRARLSDVLRASDTASMRDALLAATPWFDAVFTIRPTHNPVGPLDLRGAFDERSDRWQGLGEVIERGYEDAYRQFVEPVIGASGEALEAERGNAVRSS